MTTPSLKSLASEALELAIANAQLIVALGRNPFVAAVEVTRVAKALLALAEDNKRLTNAKESYWRDAEEQRGKAAALRARVEELEGVLRTAFNVLCVIPFEPDAGEPHPVKDGIYDRAMAEIRQALGGGE